MALDAGGLDNSGELMKVKEYQAKMRDFIKQTGVQRQPVRERVVGAAVDKARTANKTLTPKIPKLDFSSSDTHSLGISKDLRSFYSEVEPVKTVFTQCRHCYKLILQATYSQGSPGKNNDE